MGIIILTITKIEREYEKNKPGMPACSQLVYSQAEALR